MIKSIILKNKIILFISLTLIFIEDKLFKDNKYWLKNIKTKK